MSEALSIDVFDEKYTPDTSHLSEHFDDGRFETYGNDLMHIQELAADPKHQKRVWTEVDGDDGGIYLVSGFHFVNRIVYLVTEEPCESEHEEYCIQEGDSNEY